MSLEDRLIAVVTSIGNAVRALRETKADDTTVLHRSGDETKSGTLTFGSAPIIPTGTAPAHPARRDDTRFVPTGGGTGQILTKASGTDHALVWDDPAGGGAGGSYVTGTVPAGQATVTISHGLGTRDVVVMVRDTDTYAYVPVANDAPTDNAVRLSFATAPTSGQYRYVIFAALGAPVAPPAAPTAHAATHRTGGSDPVTPAAIGAAEAEHTHSGYAANDHAHWNLPGTLVGPWVTRSFSGSGLSAGPKNAGATITVPDPGFDWRPHCFAQYYFRCDISGTQTGLELQLDGGDVYARGLGAAGPLWGIAAAHPVPGPVLPAGRSRTFRTVVFPITGGGWLEATTAYDPFIMIYAIPA